MASAVPAPSCSTAVASIPGLVLADELSKSDQIDFARTRYMSRRYERCVLVVKNSIEIGRREEAGRPIDEQTMLVEQSLRVLANPI